MTMRAPEYWISVPFAILVAGCTGAGHSDMIVAEPRNLVFGGPGLDSLTAAAMKGQAKATEAPASLVAWSAKYLESEPPVVLEEALLLVPVGNDRCDRHVLAIVERSSGAIGWRLGGVALGVLKSGFREYDHAPSDQEISDFVQDSNFGLNEVDPTIHILRVLLFRSSDLLFNVLRKGIPGSERSRRQSAMLERK
jgi:hypothetical protein